MRQNVTPRELYKAQGQRCFLCGQYMSKHVHHHDDNPNGWTRDHLVPRSYLRKNRRKYLLYNIVLTHLKCNLKRGSRLPTRHQRRKRNHLYKKILH